MTATISNWLTLMGQFFHDWPALSAILIAVGLSWGPGVIWDNSIAPDGWAPRRVRRWSLCITFAVAALVSAVCWHEFAPDDGKAIVYVVSGASAMSAPVFHLLIGHVLDKWVPWINLSATLKKAE